MLRIDPGEFFLDVICIHIPPREEKDTAVGQRGTGSSKPNKRQGISRVKLIEHDCALVLQQAGIIRVFEVLVAVDAVGAHKTGIGCSVKTCSNISDAA